MSMLLITVPKTLQVRLHSDDLAATAKAHEYLRERMHRLLGEALETELDPDPSALAGAIMSSITSADHVALAALGFGGVAVALVFETEAEQPKPGAAWCCTIGCDRPAAWCVTDPAKNYDDADTHACAEHLADACEGSPGAVVTKLG